ncbi:MAG: hypothetical protein NHB14_02835 [Desulfosporosinus sp.]|jgi:hypothetical protein|nr:hypothetical protein [Desulfosporosinus sp.]
MKKQFMSFVMVIILSATLFLPAAAVQFDCIESEEIDSVSLTAEALTTDEADVPQLSAATMVLSNSLVRTDAMISSNTLAIPARAIWAEETAAVLEESYSQSVSGIYETADFIVFEFEDTPVEDITEGHILKVEYVKPESALAAGTSYSTKIIYMWGWLDGYYPVSRRTGTWAAIRDLSISVVGLNNTMSVASFVASVLLMGLDYFKPTDPVDAQSLVQYYCLNKIGEVRDPNTGLWQMLVYVGSRKSFRRCLIEKEDGYGHRVTVGVTETIPNNLRNPSNFDRMEIKNYFNDEYWIVNKAIQVYESGTRAYMDVFGLPQYFSDTVPY